MYIQVVLVLDAEQRADIRTGSARRRSEGEGMGGSRRAVKVLESCLLAVEFLHALPVVWAKPSHIVPTATFENTVLPPGLTDSYLVW